MASRSGRFALIEQFVADGFTHMFGNPGTVEQGFLDALADYPQLQYVLTLQESIAVLVADGYSRASRQPALVQIHSSPGVGNAIGNLYQAKRGGTPLVVIAGESGIKYDAMDAQMAADLVAMARPVTKWATRVVDPESMLRVMRRAIKVATTPPTGPVFVCLPADILDAPNEEQVFPSDRVVTRVGPRGGGSGARGGACSAPPSGQWSSWATASPRPMPRPSSPTSPSWSAPTSGAPTPPRSTSAPRIRSIAGRSATCGVIAARPSRRRRMSC